MAEAVRLLERGKKNTDNNCIAMLACFIMSTGDASARDIDTAMKLGAGQSLLCGATDSLA